MVRERHLGDFKESWVISFFLNCKVGTQKLVIFETKLYVIVNKITYRRI